MICCGWLVSPLSGIAQVAGRTFSMDEPAATMAALMVRAAGGDAPAWGALLTQHEERLRRMVGFRLDRRLAGRIDAADVVQEGFVEAADHRAEYFRRPEVPLFLWLR